MEINPLLMALGLALFGGGADNPTSASTQNPNPSTETYITSTDSHCKVENTRPLANETVTWNGKCVNGFANGRGTVQWYQNGEKTSTFIGNLRNGKMHGKGKAIWSSGNIYEGDWVNGKQEGKGKKTWADGYVYQGEYSNGKQNGQGKIRQANGSVYQGGWLDSKPNGYGKLTLVKNDNLIDYWKPRNQGHWQGDVYIVQGIFKDDDLEIECSSVEECEQKQKREAKGKEK